MPVVSCIKCSKKFYSKPFAIRSGGGKYCSLVCKYLGTKNGMDMKCSICDQVTYKSLKSIKSSKSGKYFCSKSCQTKWRNQLYIGPKHSNWKHGKNAYRSVLVRNKIFKKCTLCGSNDERILAVHHVDRNRKNNELKNLAWLCHNCHFLVHHDNVERQRFLSLHSKR